MSCVSNSREQTPDRKRHRRLREYAPLVLAALVILTPTTGFADDKKPGFFERLFGRGDNAPVHRSGAENIAWKAGMAPELYDGDYRTCVAVSGSEKLEVGSAVIVHFKQPAKITGASVYVRRLSEEGDIRGKFLAKRMGWFFEFGRITQLGTNTQAGVSLKNPRTSSDLKFEVNQITGPDADICLTELEVYGSLKGEQKAPFPNAWLQGNWLGEYSDADGVKGNTILRTYAIWPDEQTASTGNWNIKSCYTSAYNAACGTEAYTVSPEGKVHAQYSYGFMGHWGGVSDLKLVGPDEMRGRWNYQGRYDGAVVWRRVQPEITRITLQSQVTDRFDLGARPGRVELTYDGYWWGASVSARANRPEFHLEVYGKNLWGIHNVRIEPQSRSANYEDWDIEYRGYGEIKDAGHGPPSDVVGLRMGFTVWSSVTPGRKTLYIDGIPIPFDFVVHGHPQADDVVWPEDATTPEDLKELPPKIEFVSAEETQKVLDDVPLGTPFRVRMTFENNRDEQSFPVQLRTRRSGADLQTTALRTDDPKIYLSEPLDTTPSKKWDGEAKGDSNPE